MCHDDLAALESITGDDLSALPFDELVLALARRLAEVSDAQLGVILLLDETGQFTPRAAQVLRRADAASPLAIAREFATQLVREAIPLAIADLRQAALGADARVLAHGILSLLGAPLKVRGRVIGAVYVGRPVPHECSANTLHRFAVLADRAALAIEHARLLEESQRYAAELERANELLREVDRLKSEFLSMVSHELRTPLTAILGYTDLLLRQIHGPLSQRQLHYQRSVRIGAKRLLALVNDLLDLSRLEGGRFEVNLEPVHLETALRRAVDGIAEDAEGKGIRVEVAPGVGSQVLADQEALPQVLNNLLSNALKFTAPGGEITVGAEPSGEGEVCIWVRDSGIGLESKQLQRVWDRFYQADSTIRRTYSGAGLGLSIVKRVVELHGGRVWADSAGLGKGSTFCFTLPLAPAAPARSLAPERSPSSGATLLIAEDEPDNRDVLRTIAEVLVGLKVVEAANGLQALEVAERCRPDLILLDMMMPGMDGFEVARRLKANVRLAAIPVVAVSALAQPEDRRLALAAGADAYVTKPFEAEELAQLLRRLLAPVASG